MATRQMKHMPMYTDLNQCSYEPGKATSKVTPGLAKSTKWWVMSSKAPGRTYIEHTKLSVIRQDHYYKHTLNTD